jgi:hypothetical protein
LKTSLLHCLEKSEVLQILQNNIPLLESKIKGMSYPAGQIASVDYKWIGDQFVFQVDVMGALGGRIEGYFWVGDETVEIDLSLPLTIKMFEDTIKTKLENVITEMLTD